MSPAITKELERLDKQRVEALALDSVAEIAHAVAAIFPNLKFDVGITRWTADPPFVNLCAHQVAAFNELLPVFRELAQRGWHTDKCQPFDDYHELDRRTYNLCEPGEFPETKDPVTGALCPPFWRSKHRLRLMAFLVADGAKCRKVQTGTKQEPVYEFVCE
jgi:hypothetical protein